MKMNIKTALTIKDFIEMEKLELKYYSSEHVTPHEEAFKWYLEFPEAGVVLEDMGKIIAFIDMLPIKNDVYNNILQGTFNDKYITTYDILKIDQLEKGDKINLLLSCILVDDKYRKTNALKILLKTQLDYYYAFLNKGIVIENVLTCNVTRQGERFSERMGFCRLGVTEHGTTLYLTSFINFYNRVQKL